MKMGAEKQARLYEEITDYEKLKSVFQDVIIIKIWLKTYPVNSRSCKILSENFINIREIRIDYLKKLIRIYFFTCVKVNHAFVILLL